MEAAAIGVPHAVKGEEIVVVCAIRPGGDRRAGAPGGVDSQRVVKDLGRDPRRPAIVAVVPSLPKTRSGKIMRRMLVRAAWLGLDPGDLSALDDPTTLEAIRRAGPAGGCARPAGDDRPAGRPATKRRPDVAWAGMTSRHTGGPSITRSCSSSGTKKGAFILESDAGAAA